MQVTSTARHQSVTRDMRVTNCLYGIVVAGLHGGRGESSTS